MNTLVNHLKVLSKSGIAILDSRISMDSYVPMDLSINNGSLKVFDITDPVACQVYIDEVLEQKKGKVAYGGYLEQRNLYADKSNFNAANGLKRDIHLGVDFWCDAHTEVITPIDGVVHSFKNNAVSGDYGPTIVLRHDEGIHTFFSLYGHLSLASLDDLFEGKVFKKGSVLGALGTPDINVNYAPHLHFQLIKDMQGYQGDYPGVCAAKDLDYFQNNCPNPNLLLNL
ncbi:peptidoglycan DD-metalloendopeptidase family protein [Maribacter sp. CXY002]|uniref:peptidoglycan DD-metalloendopeptidase family protein n=1 Tax=Maribacter luteocoastalis TaxID=3407671 RepID=UPI003B67B74C